jgi:hypothetical protein
MDAKVSVTAGGSIQVSYKFATTDTNVDYILDKSADHLSVCADMLVGIAKVIAYCGCGDEDRVIRSMIHEAVGASHDVSMDTVH